MDCIKWRQATVKKLRLSMNSDKRLFKQPVGNSMDCDVQDISANNQLVLHARTHKYTYTQS
jgi:hypothetical protein